MPRKRPGHDGIATSDGFANPDGVADDHGDALVLIVEDEPDLRDAMLACVESMGFRGVGAENGRAALAVARRERPCLILLDLMMPVMNGWDFRTEQRRDPTLAEIPVIVVTAAGDASRHARALGAAGGLSKPIDYSDLQHAVEQYC